MSNPSEAALLYSQQPLGSYPMDKIQRVSHPTNLITADIQRIDLRDNAYGLAARGEYGPVVQKAVQRSLPGKYPLSAAQKDIIDHLVEVELNPVYPQAAPVPHDPLALTRHIQAAGYFLKADLVAACKVPASAYYSHDKQGVPIQPRFENAIILVMRKDWRAVQTSTGSDWFGDPISFQAYQHLALAAETLANYIRRLGWDASAQYGPSFADRYSVLLPPLLLAAGVGEVSRAGIILNPFLGLGFKAATILTDMPVVPDQPVDFGLQRFCQTCKICAENCPSRAISTGDKVLYNGYETWKLNTRRCASYNFTHTNGTMCNRCVKSCPWTNPPTLFHNLVRSAAIRWEMARRAAVWGACKWMGTTRGHPTDKWWFDMEYVDDQLVAVGSQTGNHST